MKGLVHIYTGSGKGKTTAAIGLGVRACGRGLKVLMVQFLKGAETGEIFAIKRLEPDFVLQRGRGPKKFTCNMEPEELEQAKKVQRELFETAVGSAMTGKWDLLILDEIMAAINEGMINACDVEDFIKNKPDKLELVLTGRNAPQELIALADYVSDVRAVKHPIEKGVKARKGIEI